MCGAENTFDSLVLPNNRPGLAQLREQMLRIAKRVNDFPVKRPGLGVHHAHGGGVSVFPGFDPAELVQQILRNHQQIGHALQPAGFLIGVELIDGIKGLELAAGMAVQLRKGQNFMHLRDHGFCPFVPIGIHGQNFFAALQQNIVHAPGVDRQAFDFRKFRFRRPDASFHLPQQGFNIPDKVSSFLLHAIGKAIYFFCLDSAFLHPAHDMPPRGCTNVDCKGIFQLNHLFPHIINLDLTIFSSFRIGQTTAPLR